MSYFDNQKNNQSVIESLINQTRLVDQSYDARDLKRTGKFLYSKWSSLTCMNFLHGFLKMLAILHKN